MIVKVNCPIAGCGIQVQVQNLPKHIEKVHELDGELLLRLHPTSPYTHQPEPEAGPLETADLSAEEIEAMAESLKKDDEPEPETEPVE